MACKDAYRTTDAPQLIQRDIESLNSDENVRQLWFGSDSRTNANTILQNNIDHFEWILRNKIYPNFCGRNIVGENALTKEEINFLHKKGCKIAIFFDVDYTKETEEDGKEIARIAIERGQELQLPTGIAIFLEISSEENATTAFMKGYAESLLASGYIPGFKANTDAKYSFDREYSRGIQIDRDIFKLCLIWAIAPTVPEFDRITTTHLIHPDNWKPFAPSGITRKNIAIWQYGKDCHPIQDDNEKETTFNLNLVRNDQIIISKMF